MHFPSTGSSLEPAPSPLPGPLLPRTEQVREYLRQAKAHNTRRAYRADLAHFSAWCAAQERDPLPATEETLVLYFSDLASSHKTSTLARRVSSISQAHLTAGFDS